MLDRIQCLQKVRNQLHKNNPWLKKKKMTKLKPKTVKMFKAQLKVITHHQRRQQMIQKLNRMQLRLKPLLILNQKMLRQRKQLQRVAQAQEKTHPKQRLQVELRSPMRVKMMQVKIRVKTLVKTKMPVKTLVKMQLKQLLDMEQKQKNQHKLFMCPLLSNQPN